MRCNHVQGLFSEIYDGIAEEQAILVQHLQECPSCAEKYASFCRLIDELRALPQPEVPEGFHETVMAKIRALPPDELEAAAPKIINFPQPQNKALAKAATAARRWASVAAAACVLLVSLWAMRVADFQWATRSDFAPPAPMFAPAGEPQMQYVMPAAGAAEESAELWSYGAFVDEDDYYGVDFRVFSYADMDEDSADDYAVALAPRAQEDLPAEPGEPQPEAAPDLAEEIQANLRVADEVAQYDEEVTYIERALGTVPIERTGAALPGEPPDDMPLAAPGIQAAQGGQAVEQRLTLLEGEPGMERVAQAYVMVQNNRGWSIAFGLVIALLGVSLVAALLNLQRYKRLLAKFHLRP